MSTDLTPNAERQVHLEQLELVRNRRDKLPSESNVRKALSDEELDRLKNRIIEGEAVDTFPPLYGTVCALSEEAVVAFESDINLVTQHTQPEGVRSLLNFLLTKEDRRSGNWYGGFFDLWAKSTAARSGFPFALEKQLPNGRRPDICIEIAGRDVFCECTVLTENDDSAKAWQQFLKDRKEKKLPALISALDPYEDAIRFYTKAFDKLTNNLDASKSQFSDDHPNILLVSFAGSQKCSPGVGWALDELFASQPLFGRTVESGGIPDVSMEGWIDYCAHEMVEKGEITASWYCEHYQEIVDSPRRLGGVLLFRNSRLISSRINYNASSCCSLSHEQMAAIERIFTRSVPYWT